jgi:choline transport protein
MSEEIHNPAKNVPRAMVFSILLNGTLGFGMLIATLFCLGNPDAALGSATRYPFMEIFLQAVGSVSGALTMASLITILNICATISFIASASRMTWAFARDRGTPGSRFLSKVYWAAP